MKPIKDCVCICEEPQYTADQRPVIHLMPTETNGIPDEQEISFAGIPLRLCKLSGHSIADIRLRYENGEWIIQREFIECLLNEDRSEWREVARFAANDPNEMREEERFIGYQLGEKIVTDKLTGEKWEIRPDTENPNCNKWYKL